MCKPWKLNGVGKWSKDMANHSDLVRWDVAKKAVDNYEEDVHSKPMTSND